MTLRKPAPPNSISRLLDRISQRQRARSDSTEEFAQRIRYLAHLIDTGVVSFDYESVLRTQYQKWIRPGDTVFDVGAHTGKHLQHFVSLVGSGGTVVAFEPIPFAHYHIHTTFGASNVTVHNIALSDKAGKASFTYARGTPEESGLKRKAYNFPDIADPQHIEVTIERLDTYAENITSLRFLKIDIEGGEIGCLTGAPIVLGRFRPVISVEYGAPGYSAYGHTKDTLFDLAAQHKYVLYDLLGNRLADRDIWHIACDSIYWDYFMVPAELEFEFAATLQLKPTNK
jgi:FkbM family methyltransferase